jgi:deazaflavin-dependent oxidoreductase (nitroreductase family)
MASEQEIVDSPTEWVADHIARYVQSNGEDGHMWQGVPTLLLTTVGKVSGANRRTALIYGRIGNDYVIVASKGGHPTHPLWYNNLVSHPTVQLHRRCQTVPTATPHGQRWLTSGPTSRDTKKKQTDESPWFNYNELDSCSVCS